MNPSGVGRALGMSRPTLYRIFAGSGGIAAHIRRRRLEAVHVLLLDPYETRQLSEIAHDFGFSSHAHFTTAFRRRFGYAPRDTRAGGVPGPFATAALFQNWLLNLRGHAIDRARPSVE